MTLTNARSILLAARWNPRHPESETYALPRHAVKRIPTAHILIISTQYGVYDRIHIVRSKFGTCWTPTLASLSDYGRICKRRAARESDISKRFPGRLFARVLSPRLTATLTHYQGADFKIPFDWVHKTNILARCVHYFANLLQKMVYAKDVRERARKMSSRYSWFLKRRKKFALYFKRLI